MKIIIAGGSGFIGSHLSRFFEARGETLVSLSRRPKKSNEFFWDPEKKELDLSVLEGADLVVNLAGESIFGRWTKKKKERIHRSRFVPTQFLCDSILKLKKTIPLYLNASAVGYYGDRGSEILTEESAIGPGFLPMLCREWEKIPTRLKDKNTRVILMRFGVVLGEDGGILKTIKYPFQLGLGGTLGRGNQYMSWIAIDDLIHAIDHVITHQSFVGPVNFTSPNPITNREFTKSVGKVLHRPTLLPMPKSFLKLLLADGVDAFLMSTRAYPQRLLRGDYTFHYPELESALKKYLRNK